MSVFVSYLEESCDCSKVAIKISLGSFRHTFSAPRDEDILWESRIGVFHFHKSELNLALGEIFDQIRQFALCMCYKKDQRSIACPCPCIK